MSTNRKLSGTKEERTTAGVGSVEVSQYTNYGPTHLTYTLQISGLKSRESLQQAIDDSWKTFCEQALKLTSDSSSNGITGPPVVTHSVILNGLQNTGANLPSAKKCQNNGCNNPSLSHADMCVKHFQVSPRGYS